MTGQLQILHNHYLKLLLDEAVVFIILALLVILQMIHQTIRFEENSCTIYVIIDGVSNARTIFGQDLLAVLQLIAYVSSALSALAEFAKNPSFSSIK
jgi:hypothetical protein